jgi:hypothetical protein
MSVDALRKAICAKPRHCWWRLLKHEWMPYWVEWSFEPREQHRVCARCTRHQVMVGRSWRTT